MAKIFWKGATLLSPLPAVLVSCGEGEEKNLCTVAWTGIVCSTPPMTYISLRPTRHSHGIISRTGEFAINLTTAAMCRKVDACGVYSGRKVDKFKKYGFTPAPAREIACPIVEDAPVSL